MKKESIFNRAKWTAGAAPVALGMAMLAAPSAAVAQDGAADDADNNGQVIVVTGTRVNRPDLESVSPLTVVGAEEIAATGTTRAEDLINNLPQVVAGQTAFISNGATGTATVNLRNLGSLRTLVLLDGRRLPSGDPFNTSPDINQIPAALIERIEVVTGGASATYGADAVAGVTNFIMNRDFEGIQADAQLSFYQHDNDLDTIQDLLRRTGNNSPEGSPVDGFTYDFNVAIGAGFDDGRGHVTGYLGYRQIDAISQATRDYSACALAAVTAAADPTGYTCAGSSTTPNGTFYVYGAGPGGLGFNGTPSSGIFTLDENGPGNTFRDSAAFSGTGADTYNYNPTNFFQRPDKRWTAGFFAEYEITPAIVPYAEFQFMDDRSDAQIAFSGTFFNGPATLNCSNPLLSDQQGNTLGCTDTSDTSAETVGGILIGKRLVEGAPRNNAVRHTSNRAVFGVRGDLSDNWSYDAYLLRGNTIYSNTYENDLSIARINAAINGCPAGSPGACVPLNLFQIGGVDRAQFNYIAVPAIQTADLTTYVASGYVSGNIDNPLGTVAPLSIVLGAEYRKEQYELQVDENFALGNLSGQGGPTPAQPLSSFSVREVFAELRLPLFEFGNGGSVEATGGYRLSDYNTSGTSHTYNVGLEIAPFDGVRLRGVYARAVRAPNVVELFSPQAVGLFAGNDPCAGAAPTASAAACANSGVTAAQYGNIAPNPANQYNQLAGGNPGLDVEKADSYTVGLVVDGRSLGLSGLTATLDYFNIEVDQTIAGLGAQNTLNNCVNTGDPVFCGLVNRAPGTGSLWLGQTGFVVNTQQNIGGLKTSGLDLAVGYRFPVWNGSLSANYTGTYYFDSQTQTQPTLPFYDCIGFYGNTCGSPQPEYRHRVSLGYTADAGWGLNARWRHFGSVTYDALNPSPQLNGPTALDIDDNISSYNWFDLSASYDLTDNFRLTTGVNNIFDVSPPTIASQNAGGFSNGNTYPGIYDPVGRYIFIGGRVQF